MMKIKWSVYERYLGLKAALSFETDNLAELRDFGGTPREIMEQRIKISHLHELVSEMEEQYEKYEGIRKVGTLEFIYD